MKSLAVVPSAPDPTFSQGDLFKYVGSASGSRGEIVMLLSDSRAVVIHSVTPTYPLGHLYSPFNGLPSEWGQIPSATITYSS